MKFNYSTFIGQFDFEMFKYKYREISKMGIALYICLENESLTDYKRKK